MAVKHQIKRCAWGSRALDCGGTWERVTGLTGAVLSAVDSVFRDGSYGVAAGDIYAIYGCQIGVNSTKCCVSNVEQN